MISHSDVDRSPRQRSGLPQILHVEDDATLAEMYRLGLERNGFGVTVVADGAVALQMLAEQRFDLVLLDIDLPSMDGVELLGRLRCQHHNLGLPVAVLSSLDREEPLVARAEELGVLACLVKSRTVPRALAEHIRVWLRASTSSESPR